MELKTSSSSSSERPTVSTASKYQRIDSMMSHPTKIYRNRHYCVIALRKEIGTYEDVVVSDVLKGDGCRVGVDETKQADNNTIHCHTLGTSGVVDTLCGVQGLERGIGEGVAVLSGESEGRGRNTERT